MTLDESQVVGELTPAQRVGLTLYGEARGSSLALRVAIASVIGNRARAKRSAWGLTPDAVCLKPGQFSCWSAAGGEVNHRVVMAAARALAAGELVRSAVLRGCLEIGETVIDGECGDAVSGATHYYSPAAMVPRHRVPTWAVGLEPVAVIDGTKFFAGVK